LWSANAAAVSLTPVGRVHAHHRTADARASLWIPNLHVETCLWHAVALALGLVPVFLVAALLWLADTVAGLRAEELTFWACFDFADALAYLSVEGETFSTLGWGTFASTLLLVEVLALSTGCWTANAGSGALFKVEVVKAVDCFVFAAARDCVPCSLFSIDASKAFLGQALASASLTVPCFGQVCLWAIALVNLRDAIAGAFFLIPEKF